MKENYVFWLAMFFSISWNMTTVLNYVVTFLMSASSGVKGSTTVVGEYVLTEL